MTIPVYTELSNFSVRKAGNKIQTDLSVGLIIHRDSDPVESINSLYSYISHSSSKIELIIVNMDREGYKYEKLMDTFPALRILLPQEEIDYSQAIELILGESLSEQVLFMDEAVRLQSLDLALLKSYFTQSSFGALVPRVTSNEGEAVPNVVKGSLKLGLLDTISVLMKGSAITSLYPKFACFILSRDTLSKSNIQLNPYSDRRFTLLELGYRLWKQGLMIFQGEKFKVQLVGTPQEDIRQDLENSDYLLFNYANIHDKKVVKARGARMRQKGLVYLLTLRWNKLAGLLRAIREYNRNINRNSQDPLDDETVFRTVNKDYE